MKPYKERLPLIDAAIDALKGKMETNFLFEYKDNLYYFTDDFNKGSHLSLVCTRDEFNERKRELESKEQPMKYEYGVEYETNGEKPDLPDDVLVEYMREDWKDWIGVDIVGAWRWKCCTSFRIVDDRYKPKEQDMNWYEKGERPPVGSECLWLSYRTGTWHRTKVIAYDDDRVNAWLEGEGIIDVERSDTNFRPLPTETDELVERLVKDLRKVNSLNSNMVAKSLIEQGYRKVKQMSEDEFVTQAQKELTDFIGHSNQLIKLHRADCCFLDKGK